MEKLLQIQDLGKSFNNNIILKHINFSLEKGEIHGLVGANGSGKSTLLNILFGSSVISSSGGYKGEILIEGKKLNIRTSYDSVNAGIGMIHQEFALINEMNAAENVKIRDEKVFKITEKFFGKKLAYIDKESNEKEAKAILNKLGIDMDTGVKVINLSTNMKQFVEIAREIKKENLKILLLDEPTAVLNKNDSLKLISILKDIAEKGTSIIFISHRLEEVTELCDKVTVLRDGEVVSTYCKNEFSLEKIAEDMIGHKVVKTYKNSSNKNNENIISFENFSVDMPGENVNSINLEIKKKEILGITSLSGHGKLAIPYGVMGFYKTKGIIKYKNRDITSMKIKDLIDNGIYFVTDDRKGLGILPQHSVRENIIFNAFHNKGKFMNKFFMEDKNNSKRYVEECIKNFDIKCVSQDQKLVELSGGNQQKVCISRVLAIEPEVIFISEPTRGIDINAKEKILDIIVKINKDKNSTMIICSSELEELKRVCDRIVVMYEGKIVDILDPQTEDKNFALALSGKRSGIV